MIFLKPKNPLEGAKNIPTEVSEILVPCPKCSKQPSQSELSDTLNVCPYCRHHFHVTARYRVDIVCDKGSFIELDKDMTSRNILDFPDYDKKLANALTLSRENESVITGTGKIYNYKTALFAMESHFMMGSMGVVTGEKVTRLFEHATKNHMPVIGFTVSGGARMQEGILSLMQMAKTSAAIKRHSDAGNLYIAVLTDPTTGGVTASFAMEADITAAEPFALIGFAGPRVIEQTIRSKLPDGFQRAEFLLDKGFVDTIVDRRRQKRFLAQLLKIHSRGEAHGTV
ncbi:MAG: acetyl-CoA carboxylase, carboxyltransferase subunit beta [Clostridiales bacterium]|jgi:acetyl-CoA carboxylase carboxyl transferase subunit beta|nr:acetyl-CoA carboxylase, carboxyltransferase subunit beta [Clostridiales bacterium]